MPEKESVKSIKVESSQISSKGKLGRNIVRSIKLLLVAFCLTVLAFVLLNGEYFVKQISYDIKGSQMPAPAAPVNTGQSKTPGQDSSAPNGGQLNIPSLNISAPVIYVTGTTEKVFQEALINGVVHFPGTADAGQAGNDYIFGHSSDYIWSSGHYKTVFALLPRIELGALVTLSDSAGKVYTYKVINKFVTDPNDVSVLKQDYAKHILTIQTSYPVGTALRRYIVVTELQN